MKILILCDYFAVGGGAGRIVEVSAEALAEKHEVVVLTAHGARPINGQTTKYQVFIHNLDYPLFWRNYLGLRHKKALRILEAHLNLRHPDIVYIHNLHTNWSYAALKVLAKEKIPAFLIFHDVSVFTPYVKLCGIKDGRYHYPWWRHLRQAKWTWNPLRNFLIRRYLRYATKTIAVSDELKKALTQNRIRVDAVIHNGIDLSWKSSPPIYRPINGQTTTTNENAIFFGGRLSTSKGALLAVKYLKVLKDKFRLTPTLNIAGKQGIITEKMKLEAKKMGMERQLFFLGWLTQDNYVRALVSSAVVIVPSICFDSLPTVILEAMRFSKPVIATNLGGARELVADGETGFIINPFDIEAFAAAIALLLQDEKKRETMGDAAFQRLKEEFSLKKMIDNYLKL